MQPVTICPACEQTVTLTRLESGSERCNNCWHILSPEQVKKAGALAVELERIEEARRAAFAKNR